MGVAGVDCKSWRGSSPVRRASKLRRAESMAVSCKQPTRPVSVVPGRQCRQICHSSVLMAATQEQLQSSLPGMLHVEPLTLAASFTERERMRAGPSSAG